jgi:predicted transcriptional regulator YdeE
MEIRFENRDKFKVCGYVTETNSENSEHDGGQLWINHENELREIPESKSCLYGVIWYTDETHERYCYLLGIETDKFQGNMVCVEVPTGHFAVAAVPKGMTEVEAWTEFFFKEIPARGYAPDESHGIYFEFYDKNGNCELWTPVKPINN